MFRRLFTQPTNHPAVQFIRYGFVAVAAFAVDFGLLFVFTADLHIFYLISATLSFTISLLLNYVLSIRWVFRRSHTSRLTELVLFAIIGFVGLGLNITFIWFFTAICGLYYLVSKLAATVIVFLWSFIARRYIVFRDLSSNPIAPSNRVR